MLTPKEFKQIEAALSTMQGFNIKGMGIVVSTSSVLVLLQTFVEDEKKPEPPKGPVYRGEFGDSGPCSPGTK